MIAARGVSYIDSTGNMRLRSDKPALYILTNGADKDPWPDDQPLELVATRPRRRKALTGARFSPVATDRGWAHALLLLCRRLNPIRRHRSNPRVIKRKMPRWHAKRVHHRDWPQPTGPPIATILRI